MAGIDPGRAILVDSKLPLPADAPLHSCLLTLRDPADAPFEVGQFAAAGLTIPPSIVRSVPRRQAEFFHGRWAARVVLRKLLGREVDVPVGASREPLWPAGVLGSITHCDGFAAAAVARPPALQALGIDIERLATGESLRALRSTTLDEQELGLLQSLEGAPELSEAMRITLVFSAKESLFKAAFPAVGRFFGFEAARVVEWVPAERRLVFELQETLSAGLQKGVRISAGYALIQAEVVFTWVLW